MLTLYPVFFEVEEIRCFKARQLIKFTNEDGILPQWTVIVGENGTGKTTLLQLIALMDPIGHSLLSERGPRSIHNINNYVQRSRLEEVDASLKQTLALETNLGSKPKKIAEVSWNSPTSFDVLPTDFEIYSRFYAYGAYRRSKGNTALKPPTDVGIESLFDPDYSLIHPVEWLLRQDYLNKSSNNPRRTRMLESIVEILQKLLPDVKGVSFVPHVINDFIDIEFETSFGARSFEELSDGYASMTTWVVDFCARQQRAFPESEDILLEPAVVLIDEFAMHMHPKWQRDAIAFLSRTFPNVQFIVTSHSPLILQAAPEANVVLLERKGDHVEVRNDLDALADWRIDQLLTSDLFGLITARPPRFEALIRERQAILSKEELSEQDLVRFAELERRFKKLQPSHESIVDTQIVKRALDVIHGKGS